MKFKQIIIISLTALFLIPTKDNKDAIYLAAPASMANVITEVVSTYDENVKLNFAGSGTLVNQIQQGAPADVFISASVDNFDNLKTTNEMLEQETLVFNNLVLITNKKQNISSIEDINTLAIGTPEIVPAGTYALEALDYYDLTDYFTDKIIQTKDVSEVLTYVETNNVDAGIVYMTDAMTSDKVEILYEIPSISHSPIEYKIGLLTEEGRELYDFLTSTTNKEKYQEYGFDING